MNIVSFHFAVRAALAVFAAQGAAAAELDSLVTRTTELRADRYIDAASLRRIQPGTRVETLKTEAGWVQVRIDGISGWIRATGLGGERAAVAPLARVESGRSAPGNIVVAAGIRRIPKASRHALIIGVESAAAGGRPEMRWPGVEHDVDAARMIARRMAIPDDNVETVLDRQSTLRGIDDALDRLAQRVQPGDQVLVYFSGPGTTVASGAPTDACEGAWVAADGSSLAAKALAQRLAPAFANASKVMVVSDVAYASAQGAPALQGALPKFLRAVPASRCSSRPDGASMPLVDAARAAGAPAPNIVHVQSAPGAAQGLDQADGGGLFTQAWVDCMLGDASDIDGSGSITIAEIVTCMNVRKTPNAGARAPTAPMSTAAVSGNSAFSPFSAVDPAGAGAAVTAAVTAPAPAPSGATASALSAIEDVLAQRDGRIEVTLKAVPPALQIGRDFLELTLTSSRSGFVYLVLLGSDQSSFYLLFPNDLDKSNRIAAGETLQLPHQNWRIQSHGPPGRDVLLAVVTESERDLAALEGRKAGPFTAVLSDAQGRARLQWLLARSSRAEVESCVTGGRKRNLAVVSVCSDAFGAARIEIVER